MRLYACAVLCSAESLSHVRLFATLWTVAHQAPPGKNTGVGCHALLQGIFPTQGLSPGLLHCRQILYQLSYLGSLTICLKLYIVLKIYAFHVMLTWDENIGRIPSTFTNSPFGKHIIYLISESVIYSVPNYFTLLNSYSPDIFI